MRKIGWIADSLLLSLFFYAYILIFLSEITLLIHESGRTLSYKNKKNTPLPFAIFSFFFLSAPFYFHLLLVNMIKLRLKNLTKRVVVILPSRKHAYIRLTILIISYCSLSLSLFFSVLTFFIVIYVIQSI
jgi:hypothetical protein